MFEQQFIQQLLTAVRPEIKALIKEVIAGEGGQPLIVDYEEAGRMIGTTYEGIRKLVRKGKLTAVSRSGRHRGIAVAELKDYVQRSQLMPEWPTSLRAMSDGGS
jgi:excisionase family DNA binding protein